MENKYIVYKNDYNKLCNYRLNDVNLELDSSVDDYISSNNILIGGGGRWDNKAVSVFFLIISILIGFTVALIGIITSTWLVNNKEDNELLSIISIIVGFTVALIGIIISIIMILLLNLLG